MDTPVQSTVKMQNIIITGFCPVLVNPRYVDCFPPKFSYTYSRYYKQRHTVCTLSYIRLFYPSNFWNLSMLWHGLIVHSFLFLNSSPLHEYTEVCLASWQTSGLLPVFGAYECSCCEHSGNGIFMDISFHFFWSGIARL